MQKETLADGFMTNLKKDQEQDDLLENDRKHRADQVHEALREMVLRSERQAKAVDRDRPSQEAGEENHPKQGRVHQGRQTDLSASTT